MFNNTGTRSTAPQFTVDATLPILAFTGATLPNKTVTSGTFLTGQIDIIELNLGQFIRNRNGSGYPVYDSGLLLMYNFNNVSALGESASTIKDMSIYTITGTNSGATRTGRGDGMYSFDGISNKITLSTGIA
jgi:hypothetical protein